MQQCHGFESITLLMRNAPKKGSLAEVKQEVPLILEQQPPGELFITLLNVIDGVIIQLSSVWENNVI